MKKLLVVLAVLAGIILSGCVEEEYEMILPITNKVGDFVDGETITGQTSEATGIVLTHLLRCQSEINPSDVIPPIKFKAVFEPGGLPPTDRGIALTGVEGTFQDGETVVGGTSGATAEVDEWTSQYISAWGWSYILKKDGEGPVDERTPEGIEQAWVAYDSAEIDEGGLSYATRWGVYWTGTRYKAGGMMMRLDFDTSNIKAGATSLKLRISVSSIDAYEGNPILQLFTQYGSFIAANWHSGSILAQKEITGSGYHYLDIPLGYINYAGYTYFRSTLARIEAENKIYAEALKRVTYDSPISNCRLELSR